MLGEIEADIKKIEVEYANVVQELVDRLINNDIRVQQAIADSFIAWQGGAKIKERKLTYYAIIKAKTDALKDLLLTKKGKQLL